MPWITGTMANGQMENNYALATLGKRTWLVVALEFGPRDAVVTWADGILKTYPSTPSILLTHAYLYGDGTRYDWVSKTDQAFNPVAYGYTPSEGINDGEALWKKLVEPNLNVKMVFCGHDPRDTGARQISARADGSRVHEMLSDYQWLHSGQPDYLGGSGYLRVIEMDEGKHELRTRTYSPKLNMSLDTGDDQFTLPLEL